MNGFDKLKEIGAQKIHEKTHITREHVQAILHYSFEGMNKVQFLGFISILEREYAVELNELKIKGLEYFLNVTSSDKRDDNFFIEEDTKSNNKIYIVLALLLVVILFFFILNGTFFNKSEENSQKIDDTNIEKIKENIIKEPKLIVGTNISVTAENNLTKDVDVTIKNKVEPKAIEVSKTFKIMPNKRLWISYKDLKKNRTYQKTFSGELSLDAKKDWLLSLGHGNVNIEVNGKTIEYHYKGNIKFLYKESNLTKITISKFNAIKRENRW